MQVCSVKQTAGEMPAITKWQSVTPIKKRRQSILMQSQEFRWQAVCCTMSTNHDAFEISCQIGPMLCHKMLPKSHSCLNISCDDSSKRNLNTTCWTVTKWYRPRTSRICHTHMNSDIFRPWHTAWIQQNSVFYITVFLRTVLKVSATCTLWSLFVTWTGYLMCSLSLLNTSSASSPVFNRIRSGTGGGWTSGAGTQTSITLFEPMRLTGSPAVRSVLTSTFPRLVSARTINCIFSPAGFRYNVPIPRSWNEASFFKNTLHLKR